MYTKPYFAVRYFNGSFFTPNVGSKMPYGSAANRLYSILNPPDYRSVDWNTKSIQISQRVVSNATPAFENIEQEQATIEAPGNRKFLGVKIVASAKAPHTTTSYLLSGLGNQFLVNGKDIRKDINSL